MNADITPIDSKIRLQLDTERQVDKELPSEREVQLLAREVFIDLLARSGDPADRRNVDKAWRDTKATVEGYMNGCHEVAAVYRLHRQRKIRARMLLT